MLFQNRLVHMPLPGIRTFVEIHSGGNKRHACNRKIVGKCAGGNP